ncbi:TetR/AcrR family transcriptional regulator [Vagococcus fluvialis]|uniref:TetR/AcrR family transcriptional regulator n=1 Tax=Vagococcus fluvialis TaxID=2738 RepID=UPI001432D558|nr:TetR/AcrR family transcriptional regulator [Vagococcus fluvialis]MBO0488489.1 TetR family transcriptional regulator [Vagococcus fluvialis]NKC60276.1 TetR/AcrR family transcriptional regulator [Vagococcus fluvialis]NKD50946.1 TetR/AcrR family transcriptional regulator [Vagococcus fluvialis]WNF89419.1 TetR family transcriptional regulator [Vagococcus fluvialis]
MPSNTFFRLEKEKQDKILEASKKEFSKFPLEEASIANIVKEAGIPRGSFYQYFTGKEDVFFYLFEEVRRNLEDSFISYLEKTNGDLFETFKLFFYDFSKEALEGENKDFFRHTFLHMNYTRSNQMMVSEMSEEERQRHLNHRKHHHQDRDRYEKIMSSINKEKLNVKNEREFKMLFHQLWSMLFHTINEAYRMRHVSGRIDYKQLASDFYLKLTWLQFGVTK